MSMQATTKALTFTKPVITPAASGVLQRACGCGQHTSSGGECEECKKKHEGVLQRSAIQTKLAINEPGDEYEREADRTADLVVHTPKAADILSTAWNLPAITPYAQRQPAATADPATIGGPATGTSLEARLADAATSGSPLPAGVREPMEASFGVDFSSIRIHTGSAATSLSDDLDAIAFTHGRHIYFAPGAYSPNMPGGRRLLAHELTHVVQQGGGTGAAMRQPERRAIQRAPRARRAPRVESKRYYTGEGPLSGKGVHKGVETRLLDDPANKNLIVEAPIPGGTTNKVFTAGNLDNFDVVGRADLYTSEHSSNAAVVGVRGYIEDKDVDYAHRKPEFHRLRIGGVRAASGATKWQPDAPDGGGGISGTFPSWFAVADLKPLSKTKAGEGLAQTANYIHGMPEFAKQAKLEGALKQTGTVNGSPLTGLHIPDGLNYWMLDSEPPGRPAPGNFIVGNRRYWVAEGRKSGLFFYFDLADPAPSRQARLAQKPILAQLEPVRKGLHFHEPGPSHTVQLTPRRRLGSPARTAVQRQPAVTRPKRDWKKEGEDWEKGRAKWDSAYAKPFLKTKDAKSIRERVEVEQHLKDGLTKEPFSTDAKGFKSIELWSGTTGKLFGWLRFKFGATFDKVVGFYERINAKFKSLHGKMTGIKAGGRGWQGQLIGVLVPALKFGFVQLLKTLYELFAGCVQGLLNKVVQKFTEDLSEELFSYMEELHKKWEEYSEKFKTEFESRFGRWDEFIADLSDVTKWVSIAGNLVNMIRLGVQVISCLAPPAAGCIWGLVVQLSIESMLRLVMGTKWFDRNIVKPTVRNLIRRFAGPAFQGLMDDSLELVGLTEFAGSVRECHAMDPDQVTEQAVQQIPELENTVPDDQLRTKRDKWYKENDAEVQQAKRQAGGGGAAPDPKELEEKVKEESARTQKQIRKTLGWPDQKESDELWSMLYPMRDKISGENGPANGGEISRLADEAAQGHLSAKQIKDAVEKAPKGRDGRASAAWLLQFFRGGGQSVGGTATSSGNSGSGAGSTPLPGAPNQDRPSHGIPPISIRKRYEIPDPGPDVRIGPQVFTPPPGKPEEDPKVLPGIEIPFGK